ncbi:MAG: hypothetical protein ACE5E1_02720 [Phycisphaerae bacterium]
MTRNFRTSILILSLATIPPSGCAGTGAMNDRAAVAPLKPADAVMYINGMSCPF